jgi:flagellar FliJ protein
MSHDTTRVRTSLHTLQPVLERAERERDDAAAALRQAERALQQAEFQATQISDYRSETQARWQAQFRQGAAITLVHCYQDFVTRLHGAEAHSDASVGAAQSRCAAARAVLQAAELRLASVSRLRERRESVLREGLERRDQRQTDEAAARAAARRERPEHDTAHLPAPGTEHGELAPLPQAPSQASPQPPSSLRLPLPSPVQAPLQPLQPLQPAHATHATHATHARAPAHRG